MAKLTPNQKIFADEYLIDLNATRAYKVAYKRVKKDATARANSSRLLTNANVKEYIDKKMKEREKRTEVTQDKVVKELAAIAFSKGSDYAEIVEEPIIINGSYVKDPDTNQLRMQERVKVTPTDKLSEDKKKAISGIKEGKYGVEVSTCDKVRALELLGKHLGMFTDKVELSGETDVTIKIGSDEYGD